MSGGHFNYDQYRIINIIEEIEGIIINNDSEELDDWGETIGRNYSSEIIEKFKEGVKVLKIAHTYAQRIDWLLSGDDGEEAFLKRLENDIAMQKYETDR